MNTNVIVEQPPKKKRGRPPKNGNVSSKWEKFRHEHPESYQLYLAKNRMKYYAQKELLEPIICDICFGYKTPFAQNMKKHKEMHERKMIYKQEFIINQSSKKND